MMNTDKRVHRGYTGRKESLRNGLREGVRALRKQSKQKVQGREGGCDDEDLRNLCI